MARSLILGALAGALTLALLSATGVNAQSPVPGGAVTARDNARALESMKQDALRTNAEEAMKAKEKAKADADKAAVSQTPTPDPVKK